MLRRKFIIDVVVPAFCMCWVAFFVYTAIAGDGGYGTLADLRAELYEKNKEVDALRQRRIALEKRADMLNSRSLDPDLIDERIRAILGYSAQGDIVISRNELDQILSRARSQAQ